MLARLIVVVQLIAMLFVFGGLSTLPFKASSSPIKGGSPLLRGDVGGGADGLRAEHLALAGEEVKA